MKGCGIIKKSITIEIPGIIVALKENLKLLSYKDGDLIDVSLEFNLDYLSNNSDEVLEFNKIIEFHLDEISNFMSLEIKTYTVLVVENTGVELEIEFAIESLIEEYKDEIIKKEDELFDDVLQRECPNVIDSVNKSIYFNKESGVSNYKILFLNENDDIDELINKYNLTPDSFYGEDLRLLNRVVIIDEWNN